MLKDNFFSVEKYGQVTGKIQTLEWDNGGKYFYFILNNNDLN